MKTKDKPMPTFPFPGPLVPATFGKRRNRFLAEVNVGGQTVPVHVPNTGRMQELLVPGAPVRLLPQGGPQRKTQYDLLLVEYQGHWVCTDSREANRIVHSLLLRMKQGDPLRLPDPDAAVWQVFSGLTEVKREAAHAGHRIDFALYHGENMSLLEVKSVNLVEEGIAKFPDAPTDRGRRHVDLLRETTKEGTPCHVVFVVQRDDATAFQPHIERDPAFAKALQEAAATGVGVHALSLTVSPEGFTLSHVLPVQL